MRITAATTSRTFVVELDEEEMAALLGKPTPLSQLVLDRLVAGAQIPILKTLRALRAILRQTAAAGQLATQLRAAATALEAGVGAAPDITTEE